MPLAAASSGSRSWPGGIAVARALARPSRSFCAAATFFVASMTPRAPNRPDSPALAAALVYRLIALARATSSCGRISAFSATNSMRPMASDTALDASMSALYSGADISAALACASRPALARFTLPACVPSAACACLSAATGASIFDACRRPRAARSTLSAAAIAAPFLAGVMLAAPSPSRTLRSSSAVAAATPFAAARSRAESAGSARTPLAVAASAACAVSNCCWAVLKAWAAPGLPRRTSSAAAIIFATCSATARAALRRSGLPSKARPRAALSRAPTSIPRSRAVASMAPHAARLSGAAASTCDDSLAAFFWAPSLALSSSFSNCSRVSWDGAPACRAS
mmetsp:Transcript_1669/g.5366  ORF Transcript_1669/g.5366 Transcript_1669/m.5366 type:complete len:342 (+) Transcript_1669:3514-4539(+)